MNKKISAIDRNFKNLLVTGGCGFIGGNFIRRILSKDESINVVNLDVLSYCSDTSAFEYLHSDSRYKFVEGDICDKNLVKEILSSYEVDSVVHFAAETHVDRSIADPSGCIRSNIRGTYSLLESLRRILERDKRRLLRLHHVSTDEVFGHLAKNEKAWTESARYDPRSPYSASKAASDHLVRAYGATYQLPYTISNCTNTYGPYQYPEKLIPMTILKSLLAEPITIYGKGDQIRDWLYVDDHTDAIELIMRNGNFGETYNISGNSPSTNKETVALIHNCINALTHDAICKTRGGKDRKAHDFRYALDSTKIKSELGWEPQITFHQGIHNTVKWYLDNRDWLLSKSSEIKVWENTIVLDDVNNTEIPDSI